MPRWAIWLCNILVIAVLATWGYFLKWAGPEFCAGLIIGFSFCYINYRCWRQDYAEEAKAHFIDQPEAPPRRPSPQHLSGH